MLSQMTRFMLRSSISLSVLLAGTLLDAYMLRRRCSLSYQCLAISMFFPSETASVGMVWFTRLSRHIFLSMYSAKLLHSSWPIYVDLERSLLSLIMPRTAFAIACRPSYIGNITTVHNASHCHITAITTHPPKKLFVKIQFR